MQMSSPAPSVSLILNLSAATNEQADSGIRTLSPLFERGTLTATWVVAEPRQVERIASGLLASTAHEFAATVSARTPQRLRSELLALQASVQQLAGSPLSTVQGDAVQLRSRAALLSDLGVNAVVSETQTSQPAKPRALPCGIWQLDAVVSIPQPRGRWSVFPTRRPSVKQLLEDDGASNPRVVAIDFAAVGSRDLQSCESLLREISQAVEQQQLQVATVSTLAAELTKLHQVKPQRSILRRAA